MWPWCAWCGERIKGEPVDDRGSSYHPFCAELRAAALGRPALARPDPPTKDAP